MIIELTEENFILFAASKYDNPQCHDVQEFYDDLKRFKYLKRLFGRYRESGDLKERLILNHLIILYNVFGKDATRMLFFKLKDFQSYLKPFVILLGYMPDYIKEGDTIIYNSDISMDSNIVNILRKI